MPKLLSELIQSVATKAGIPADSAELKAIVTNAEVMKVSVPDTLATSIDSGIHSLESAESVLKPKIEKTIRAEVYNGIDASIYDLGKTGFGLTDDELEPFKKAEKTNERIKLLAGKVAELTEKKAGAAAPDKAKITAEINALNQKISDITKSHNDALAQKDSEHLNEITSIMADRSLAGHTYAMAVPIDVNITTAKQYLNKSFAKDGLKAVYDKATGEMKLVKQDGADYYDPKTNTKVSYSDYEKAVLAENKLLKVADSSGGNGGQGGNSGNGGNGGGGNSGGGSGNDRNSSFVSLMDADIQSEGGK